VRKRKKEGRGEKKRRETGEAGVRQGREAEKKTRLFSVVAKKRSSGKLLRKRKPPRRGRRMPPGRPVSKHFQGEGKRVRGKIGRARLVPGGRDCEKREVGEDARGDSTSSQKENGKPSPMWGVELKGGRPPKRGKAIKKRGGPRGEGKFSGLSRDGVGLSSGVNLRRHAAAREGKRAKKRGRKREKVQFQKKRQNALAYGTSRKEYPAKAKGRRP